MLTRDTEWVAGDHTSIAQWEYGVTTDNIAYHRSWRQEQLIYSETNNQADWGYWYWATDNINTLTFQSGQDIVVRGNFEANGTLPDTQDTDWRPIDEDWPVFGFAVDLGTLSKGDSASTLYTLGVTQEFAIQFVGADGPTEQPVPSLWTSYFDTELDAVSTLNQFLC